MKEFCSVATPAIVLPSYYGHLLYTPDDLEKDCVDGKQFIQLDIGDLLNKDFKDKSIYELSTVNPNLVPILSYWGTQGSPINCDANALSINTHAGRKKLTMDEYVARINIEKPPVVISLADEVSLLYFYLFPTYIDFFRLVKMLEIIERRKQSIDPGRG
jgi:hypothetical protein